MDYAMKELYAKLFKDCVTTTYRMSNKVWAFNQLGHFVSMAGPKFHKEPVRLMIVGRATNGWPGLCCDNEDAFGSDAAEKFSAKGFSWVVNSEDGRGLRNTEEDYYLSTSPFWRTSKQIWEQLSGKTDDRWVDYIAWSNIYKVAPKNDTEETRYDYANPSKTLCRKQLSACQEILKHEIEVYQPTHILFISGWDWFFDWATDFGRNTGKTLFGELCQLPPLGKNNPKNGVYVEGCLSYETKDRAIPVVVACRPEYRPEQEYIDQVVTHFPKEETP